MPRAKHVILCVDDDQDILLSLRVVLESKGYEVVTAATGREGLDAYAQCRPDVVIVDLMMEEVDSGLTFARTLQSLGNTAPVFFLSSTGDYMYGTVDVGEVGAAGVFQKPIDPAVLLRVVGQKIGAAVGKA
jgi:DNA-binding response OmpR family regulator